ncbi:MAG: hypothetical protein ACOX1H_02710 [Pseudoramibacter sp.]
MKRLKVKYKIMENEREITHQYTKYLITEDVRSILYSLYNLLITGKFNFVSSLFSLYTALYCNEANRYLYIETIAEKEKNKVKDLRNEIKIFTDKYGKTKNKIEDIAKEEIQRFDELEGEGSDNLAVFLTSQNKIIYNSHLLLLNDEYLSKDFSFIAKECMHSGEMLGSELNKIRRTLGLDLNDEDEKIFSLINNKDIDEEIGTINLKVNNNNNLFVYERELSLNLTLLHLVSLIGFVNNIISKMMPYYDLWTFRIRYITVHIIVDSLRAIKNKINIEPLENAEFFNALKPLLDENVTNSGKNPIISDNFRSCMMHYGFYNKGQCSIKDKYLDPKKPFCGLVESCFSQPFNEYNEKLIDYSIKLENSLQQFFNIDENQIEWDFA